MAFICVVGSLMNVLSAGGDGSATQLRFTPPRAARWCPRTVRLRGLHDGGRHNGVIQCRVQPHTIVGKVAGIVCEPAEGCGLRHSHQLRDRGLGNHTAAMCDDTPARPSHVRSSAYRSVHACRQCDREVVVRTPVGSAGENTGTVKRAGKRDVHLNAATPRTNVRHPQRRAQV